MTSTPRVQRFRDRRRRSAVLTPRLPIDPEERDLLVDLGALKQWDETDGNAVGAAIKELLRRARGVR